MFLQTVNNSTEAQAVLFSIVRKISSDYEDAQLNHPRVRKQIASKALSETKSRYPEVAPSLWAEAALALAEQG